MAAATKPRKRIQPDWCSLPICLLASIAEFLPTQVDVLRFRAVCRSFRSSITPSPDPSLLNIKFPHTIPDDRELVHQLILKQSFIYAIEPVETNNKTETWVLRVEELGSGLVSLKNPFRGENCWSKMHDKLPKSFNLVDYRIKLMGKVFELRSNPDYGISDKKFESSKAVVADDGSAVMAILNYGALVVWRNGDEGWTNIDIGLKPSCADIIYHNGKFYAMYDYDILITVDPKSLESTDIEFDILRLGHMRTTNSKYFVKSSDGLFMLIFKFFGFGDDGYPDAEHMILNSNKAKSYINRFSILKFDEQKKQFFPTDNKNTFKERVVFIGDDFSFCVSSEEFPRLGRNFVYLRDFDFAIFDENHDILHDQGEDDYNSLHEGDQLSLDGEYDYLSGYEDEEEEYKDEEDEKGEDVIRRGLRSVRVFDLNKSIVWKLFACSNNVIIWPPPTWLNSSSRSCHGDHHT